MTTCIHCQQLTCDAPAYLGVKYIHTSGYQFCTIAGSVQLTKATPSADLATAI